MAKKKILLVEDNLFLRELLAKKLDAKNYEAIEAPDGETALKKIKEVKPDLVLLDLILPGIQGFEVLERITRDEDKDIASVPVMIISNLSDEKDMKRGHELGAADYMVKAQFTPQEIVNKIGEMLGT